MADRLYLVNIQGGAQYLALCAGNTHSRYDEDQIEELLNDRPTIKQMTLLDPARKTATTAIFPLRAVARVDKLM